MAVSSATMFRLYLAGERLREGLSSRSDPSPLGRMRGILALDDAVELALVTLLPLLSIRPKRDVSLAELLRDLVKVTPGLGSHCGPMEHLRSVRNGTKHDGVVPSVEELRLNAVEAESFVRAAISAITGLTLEQISPLEAIDDAELKSHLTTAIAKFEEQEYLEVCISASQAFALGRRRYEFRTEEPGHRDPSARLMDDLVRFLSRAADRAAGRARNSDVREFGRTLGSAFKDESFHARDIFEGVARSTNLARLAIDLVEFERFERLTPHINVNRDGQWCEVVMTRELTPNKDDALFVLDFVTRSLLGLQDQLAGRLYESARR